MKMTTDRSYADSEKGCVVLPPRFRRVSAPSVVLRP